LMMHRRNLGSLIRDVEEYVDLQATEAGRA
jgi:hypothetical protein